MLNNGWYTKYNILWRWVGGVIILLSVSGVGGVRLFWYSLFFKWTLVLGSGNCLDSMLLFIILYIGGLI